MPTRGNRIRTAEAAMGKPDPNETKKIGDEGQIEVRYLSLRLAETRRMENAQNENDIDAMYDTLYDIIERRYAGEPDEFPDRDEFEEIVGADELYEVLAWLQGVDPSAVRRAFLAGK